MAEHPGQQRSGEGSPSGAARRGRRGGVRGLLMRHPLRVLEAIAAILVMVVVLQNVEPTSFHILFWSIGSVPKLVLILVAMAVGAVLWEVLRRLLFRS